MPAGIYSVTNIVAAAIGTVMSGPFGSLSVPQTPEIDVTASARPGYVLHLEGAGGEDLGRAVSSVPLRVEMDALPDHFINAVIAAEDTRYLEHAGIDPVGTLSAALDTARGRLRGGSTITQQMVKNTLTGNERSLGRKVVEAMVAVRAHDALGKREVLRRYLQSAWFGRGTGATDAPRAWFGKEWDAVSLAESATLAAMLKGPGLYDPWTNPDLTRKRRDLVIARMADLGWVTAEAAETARAEPVTAIAPPAEPGADPWIAAAARAELSAQGTPPARGTARLTADMRLQEIATATLTEAIIAQSPILAPERVAPERLQEITALGEAARLPGDLRVALPAGSPYSSALLLSKDEGGWDVLTVAGGLTHDVRLDDPHRDYQPAPGDLVPVLAGAAGDGQASMQIRLPTQIQGAVVILDPKSGALLASVGGADAGLTGFDRTRALRQPGSSIKPFLWLAALGMGFDAWSPVEDIEHTYIGPDGLRWSPKNYDHSQAGLIPLHAGLERSSNLAAAWLADRIGIEAMAAMAEAAGAYPGNGMRRHLSAALGTSEVSLRDLVAGYAAIVNDGMPRTPHLISSVITPDGSATTADHRRPGPIAGRAAINDLLAMLRGVVTRGTAAEAFRGHPVTLVGKTGTTQDYRDAWFVGMTPDLAIGVWLGRDDNTPLPDGMTGGRAAAPIAARILKAAHDVGIIDGLGIGDGVMSAGIDWPPQPHEARRIQRPATPAVADRGAHDEADGFWAITDDQRDRPVDLGPENRNADLLDQTFWN
ncbi:transglycosylase domain-containing protein [Defluviimonas salinarum]|uniref:peptidoglycan glycosyltransferase n=1 Tax=Defluviimonas salinarum TaxID=2992147 RepID=A0ABT3J4I2_9RHOB|nr:transglycosylase domain-containing protein [Defluviimonas salinarum]MCW3782600.1 transglycosylase domain-containing protein [Defluviimonas salinarum]